MKKYWYRIENLENKICFTVFSPKHGECGAPDSRTGYGANLSEAIDDCEWSDRVSTENI